LFLITGDQDRIDAQRARHGQDGSQHRGGVPAPPHRGADLVADVTPELAQARRETVADRDAAQVLITAQLPQRGGRDVSLRARRVLQPLVAQPADVMASLTAFT
jgi:hypothetical protein